MQLIEPTMSQRSQLPLPAATLVIDMRGLDDKVIDWLRIEVADLAGEMKSYDIHHWRYLTEFLSFMRLAPLREEETGHKGYGQNNHTAPTAPAFGLMGEVHPVEPQNGLLFDNLRVPLDAGDIPFNLFEQTISTLIMEIDRLRNNRIAALKDLNRAAIPGQSSADATVRVIFLTDIEIPETLSSAALYAERLKTYYRRFERPGHQSMLNTSVVCLSNSGESGPPALLIKRLLRKQSWSHLDSLILTENYSEEAARIAGSLQAYVAELMLYVLLLIPPFGTATDDQQEEPANGDQKNGEQKIALPLHTYIVGLAAIEYSARWGKRWLNFGLARDVVNLLRQRPANASREKLAQADIVSIWFHDWCERVRETIPEGVPGTAEATPALDGLHRTRQAVDAPRHVFSTRHFSLDIGETTIRDLEDYVAQLKKMYLSSTREPAMQDALQPGSAQIMQVLREKENQPLEERRVNDLVQLQIEAEQILGNPRFFTRAVGAVPRALAQLEALSAVITRFQQKHRDDPLNREDGLKQRQQALESEGKKKIGDLKQHLEHWPLLAGYPISRAILSALTLALILFMSGVAIFASSAWLHHLIVERMSSLLGFVDAALLGVPTLDIIAAIIFLLVLGAELALFWPVVLNKNRRGFFVELAFMVALVALVLQGIFVHYLLVNLSSQINDPSSIQYLLWLSFVPGVALIAALLAIVILVGEALYFIWWLAYLKRERQEIVAQLRKQLRQDMQDVIAFVAGNLTLELAQHAELTDGNGGLGATYHRLMQLCNALDRLAEEIEAQHQLAAERLLFAQNETQQTMGGPVRTGTWLNLHIRDEKLEMDELTNQYKGVRQQLNSEIREFKDLAEFLLRIEGVEQPAELERQFEDRVETFDSGEYQLQMFMTALVSIALRFAVDPLSIRNVGSLDEHYHGQKEGAWQEVPALNSLVRLLNKNISRAMLHSSTTKKGAENGQASGRTIAAMAVSLWGQMLWQQKDGKLGQILQSDGVLAHLERQLQDDYDPRAIMRRLLIHADFFGRSLRVGQKAEVYLLLSPSAQGYEFRQGLRSQPLHIIDFPDEERMLLMGVKRFVAEPVMLSGPLKEKTDALPSVPAPAPSVAENGDTPTGNPLSDATLIVDAHAAAGGTVPALANGHTQTPVDPHDTSITP